MSGGFPIKCDLCAISNGDSPVRDFLATLTEEYALLAPLPQIYSSKGTSWIFHLKLDKDHRVTQSVNVPIPKGELTLQGCLDQFLAHECVQLESQIVILGRVLESKLTLCRRGGSGPTSLSIIFPQSEQVLPLMQDEDQGRSMQQFLIDMAIAAASQGFLVDYSLPDDPDVEFIEGAAIAARLVRTATKTTRMWRGISRPGLIVGAREGLTSLDAIRAAWGPSAKIFSSRGFVGLTLL